MEELQQLLSVVGALILLSCPATQSCVYSFNSRTSHNGTFSSPGYPEAYSRPLRCTYSFQGMIDERINITFEDFSLHPGKPVNLAERKCIYDYVDIFTVSLDGIKSWYWRYCGESIPQPIISKQQRVEIEFQSHALTRGRRKDYHGFIGRYAFIEEYWHPYKPSHPGCGAEFLRDVGGQLMSPGFPDIFPPNSECTWVIRVLRYQQVLLYFQDLDLGTGVLNACNADGPRIEIFNGFASTEVDPDWTICGQLYVLQHSIKEITSSSFRVTIRFIAGKEPTAGKGFRLSWTAFTIPDLSISKGKSSEEVCEGFYCAGGESCLPSSKLLCTPSPRYCIAKSLRCNGIPNCGAWDQSDEYLCVERILFIIGCITVPVTIVIIVIIVTLCVRRKQKQRAVAAKSTSKENIRLTVQSEPGPLHKSKTPDVYVKRLDESPATLRRYPSCHRKPCIGCEDMEICEGYTMPSVRHHANNIDIHHRDHIHANATAYQGSLGRTQTPASNHRVTFANHRGGSLDSSYRTPTPPPPPPRSPLRQADPRQADHILARKLVGSPV